MISALSSLRLYILILVMVRMCACFPYVVLSKFDNREDFILEDFTIICEGYKFLPILGTHGH